MGVERFTRAGGLLRVASATAAALVAVALAGGGPAAAAAHQDRATAPRQGTAAAGTISTVAGGVGGPAKATRVALGPIAACGVSFGAGHLYIADGGTVRKVDPATDWLTTPAGTAAAGPLGDGGPAAKASIGTCRVTMDHQRNLVIADEINNRIRVVAARTGRFYGQLMTAGHIYTVAGNGVKGFSGNGGPATKAALNLPDGVAVDSAGNLLIADSVNSRIRAVAAHTGTFYGRSMIAGDIYTIAGGGKGGDGGPATKAMLRYPRGVAADAAGNVIIADSFHSRIRVVAAHTGTSYGQRMTAGDIYTVAGNGTPGYFGDGGPATSAELDVPEGVAVDASGNLLIADPDNDRIRVVAKSTGTFYGQAMTAEHIYTIAGGGRGGLGDGGPATSARLNFPEDVTVDAAGDLLIADAQNGLVRIVAASTGTSYGRAMTAGDIYTIAGTRGVAGDGGPATKAQLGTGLGVGFDGGVAQDGAGNTLITDTGDNRIRVVAKSTGTFYGRAMTARDIYTIAGGGRHRLGDGGPATRAKLRIPQGVAVDSAGNVLIADMYTQRVRVVAERTGTFYGQSMTAGDIYTVAGGGRGGLGDGGPATGARLNFPEDVTVDAAGNLLIADATHNRVRVVAAGTGTFYGQSMTAGDIYTVAGTGAGGLSGDGGPATSAHLSYPLAVAVDAAGNLVISDHYNSVVRVVAEKTGTFYGQPMTAGDIYTVAGDGTEGYAGDGGPATSAELDWPGGVAVDPAGNLILVDTYNNRVRVVAENTGTFYGQPMTAGDIYTIAGTGTHGFSGDGGSATGAEVAFPEGVAVDRAGNLVIADSGNNRIRVITG